MYFVVIEASFFLRTKSFFNHCSLVSCICFLLKLWKLRLYQSYEFKIFVLILSQWFRKTRRNFIERDIIFDKFERYAVEITFANKFWAVRLIGQFLFNRSPVIYFRNKLLHRQALLKSRCWTFSIFVINKQLSFSWYGTFCHIDCQIFVFEFELFAERVSGKIWWKVYGGLKTQTWLLVSGQNPECSDYLLWSMEQ